MTAKPQPTSTETEREVTGTRPEWNVRVTDSQALRTIPRKTVATAAPRKRKMRRHWVSRGALEYDIRRREGRPPPSVERTKGLGSGARSSELWRARQDSFPPVRKVGGAFFLCLMRVPDSSCHLPLLKLFHEVLVRR